MNSQMNTTTTTDYQAHTTGFDIPVDPDSAEKNSTIAEVNAFISESYIHKEIWYQEMDSEVETDFSTKIQENPLLSIHFEELAHLNLQARRSLNKIALEAFHEKYALGNLPVIRLAHAQQLSAEFLADESLSAEDLDTLLRGLCIWVFCADQLKTQMFAQADASVAREYGLVKIRIEQHNLSRSVPTGKSATLRAMKI